MWILVSDNGTNINIEKYDGVTQVGETVVISDSANKFGYSWYGHIDKHPTNGTLYFSKLYDGIFAVDSSDLSYVYYEYFSGGDEWHNLLDMVVDDSGTYAYIRVEDWVGSYPWQIKRIDLSDYTTDNSVSDSNRFSTIIGIVATNGYIYLFSNYYDIRKYNPDLTYDSSITITKRAFSSPTGSRLTVDVDKDNNKLYWGSAEYSGLDLLSNIVELDLTTEIETVHSVGTNTYSPLHIVMDDNNIYVAGITKTGSYPCIYKYDKATFSEQASVTFSDLANYLVSGFIIDGSYLYCSLALSNGKIKQVAISDLSIVDTISKTTIPYNLITLNTAQLPISSIYHRWHEPVVII